MCWIFIVKDITTSDKGVCFFLFVERWTPVNLKLHYTDDEVSTHYTEPFQARYTPLLTHFRFTTSVYTFALHFSGTLSNIHQLSGKRYFNSSSPSCGTANLSWLMNCANGSGDSIRCSGKQCINVHWSGGMTRFFRPIRR